MSEFVFLTMFFTLFLCATAAVHDHPGMRVFSRVLFGRMEVDEYDVHSQRDDGLLVARRTTTAASAGDVRVLTPESGNIHAFRAVDWTAVFDVAVPPYCEGSGRYCSYFSVLDGDAVDVGPDFVLLKVCCCASFVLGLCAVVRRLLTGVVVSFSLRGRILLVRRTMLLETWRTREGAFRGFRIVSCGANYNNKHVE